MVAELQKGIYSKVLADALASPTAMRLPEEPETPVCGTCNGAGVILGAWEHAEAALLPQVESVAIARQRALRACPQCQNREERIRAANLQAQETGAFAECLAPAEVACEALLAQARWVVWMRGSIGVGKTYLANATGVKWLENHGGVCLVVAGDLLDRLRETQAEKAEEHLTDVLAYYANIPLLIIDDLGAERMTDFASEQMFKIVDRRCTHKRALIVTSNVESKDVAARIGRRIASRLRSGEIVINGKDRR